MMPLAAQAAQANDKISYGLLLTTIALEATLTALSWAGFNAEARSQKDRDSDIRDAEAGYDSGKVVPAAARLVEAVLAVRRPDEPIDQALHRADTSRPLRDVVDAATALASPREIEGRLLKAWTSVGVSTVTAQLAGPVLLYNEIFDSNLMSDSTQTIAGVVLSGAAAILVVSIVFVRQFSRALSRAIRAGKDAAGGT
jgi:hypothetical protein